MANDPSETAPRGSADSRSAVVRGTLEDRPVPRLLHELFRKQITGYLEIVDDSGDESRLYLRDGAPVHIERPNDIDRLDQVLVESGLLAAEVIRGLSATLPPGKRLGETLIERGLISARSLADVLKLQMRRKLLRLFFPRKGVFAVFVDAHPFGTGGEFGEMRIDPRCLIYPGIRAAYDEARLDAELAPLKTLRFRVLPILAASLLEAMGFPANDVTVHALAERALTLADLPVPGTKRIDSLSVVIALLYTDLLETAPLVENRTAEIPVPRMPSASHAAHPAASQAPHPTPTTAASPPAVAPAPPAVTAAALASATAAAFATGLGSAAPSPAGAAGGAGAPPALDLLARAAPPAPLPRAEAPRRTSTGTFPVVNLGKPPAPGSNAGRAVTGSHPIPAGAMNPAEWNKTPSNSAAQATLGGRITELHDKLGTISHFQLLGVSENAPLADLGAAYLKTVRLFHPDRLPGLGLGHLTEKAARIVAQLNEAQAVLADPKRRAEYVAMRARPANTPIVDSGHSIMAAERQYQMGEVLLRKGDFIKATEAFAEAMKANPLEPFYKAYWAWARWDNPGPHKDRLVRETLKIIEDTMKERPRFPTGHYWIGLLHKHLGDLQNAANAFRAAVTQDPNLLEAERELRVIELRRSKATASHAIPEKPAAATAARQKGGVINKILKR